MYLAVADGYLPLTQDSFSSTTKLGGSATYFKMNKEIEDKIDALRWCKICGDSMFLLCQSYCPIGDGEQPENRMLYCYICNSSKCNNANNDEAKSVMAFSIQVDEEDTDALDADDDEEEGFDPKKMPTAAALPPNTFPPVFLDVVDEPPEEETVTDPTELEKQLIEMAKKNEEAGNIPDDDIKELEEAVDLKDKAEDEMFEDFRTRLNREPSQCLRYQRGGEPIFMNPVQVQAKMGALPKCPDCSGDLAMEMQVMPTSAYFIHAHEFVAPNKKKGKDDGFDIGTITIYTCAKGCLLGQKGIILREEFAFVEMPPTLQADQANESRPTMRDYFLSSNPPGGDDGDNGAEGGGGGGSDKAKVTNILAKNATRLEGDSSGGDDSPLTKKE